nr:pectin acetylesterase 8-like [Ipomoea batatas]
MASNTSLPHIHTSTSTHMDTSEKTNHPNTTLPSSSKTHPNTLLPSSSKTPETHPPTSIPLFDAWLRAPNRRPSPVTGNRWVVTSELTDHKTTPTHGEDVAGTCANSGTNRTDGQSTNCPPQQHVHPTSGTHPLPQGTVSSDVPMQQIDELSFVDPKRKRTVDSWCSLFPNAKANSLLAAKSDHMPLHLQLLPQLIPNSRANFRFESLWLRESHCRDIMLECWSRTQGQSLMDRVGSCGKAIWIWGKHFARNFNRRIDFWRRRMEATKHRRDQNAEDCLGHGRDHYGRGLPRPPRPRVASAMKEAKAGIGQGRGRVHPDITMTRGMEKVWINGWEEGQHCKYRGPSRLGSSEYMYPVIGMGDMMSNTPDENPEFYNWHRVHVAYCDGSSFTSDVDGVDPVTNLTYRGARIFDALMEDFQAKGMKNAKNAIFAGSSAGGVAVMLHCDYFRALFPNTTRVKCLADSSYFINE